MRILIDDGMQIQLGTGIGNYSSYLYEALKRCGKDPVAVDVSSFKRNSSKLLGRLRYILHINSPKYYRECGKYDIAHYTNFAIPFFRNRKTRYVATVHDLAAFAHPETFSRAYALYSRLIAGYSVHHADVVLTDSYAMESEIKSRWPKYSEKIKTAYPGYYSEFSDNKDDPDDWESDMLRKRDDLKEKRFFLFVGTIEKRKNISSVIESFLKFKERTGTEDCKLVLAGRPGYGYEEFVEQAASSQYGTDVIFTGYVSSADCRKLYKSATAYIFPTIYEGFGSTQLECMANHLPLILSDIPTNREVSNDYGLFFDLENTDSLVEQMEKIICGEYDYEAKAKIADIITGEFDWSNLVQQFISIYNEVLK